MAERQTMLKSTYDSIEEVPEEFRFFIPMLMGPFASLALLA
jgi:hypothetical protein